MGLWLCRFSYLPLSGCLSAAPGLNVLVVGATNSGKTTILYQLTQTITDSSDLLTTIPTRGINVEIMSYYANGRHHKGKTTKVILWEMGSRTAVEQMWLSYLDHCQAILFVVDGKACANEVGVLETKEVMENFMLAMDRKQKNDLPIYVVTNKQDLGQQVVSSLDIRESLKLGSVLSGKTWNIGDCSAIEGYGLREAITWIISETSE